MKPNSPCIGKCTTPLGDDICKGCHRTYKEIIEWNGYSDDHKYKVIESVKKRKDILLFGVKIQ